MESTLKEMRDGLDVVDPNLTISGGVKDVYGEDAANEDQFVTPWSLSVAIGYILLRDPHHNKGLAFTDKEINAHYLRGLLPPVFISQELQVKKLMHNIRQYQVPFTQFSLMFGSYIFVIGMIATKLD